MTVMPDAPISTSTPDTSGGPIWVECPPSQTFSSEWLTQALSRHWPGSIVESAKADSVTIGTTNHYRVHLKYARGAGPASIFIKIQGRLGKRVLLSTMGLLTPETLLQGSVERVPIETPAVYAVAINRMKLDSLIVMEDLTLRGATMNIVTKPFPLERIYRGLDQLARMHGRYWNSIPPTLRGVKPWKMLFGWRTLALLGGLQGVPKMRKYGVIDVIPPELQVWSSCMWLTKKAIELSSQGPQTLIHGDTHVGNTYNLPNGDLGFVDWQCVHQGSWSRDIAYFMMCGLDVEDRRRHERDMLRYYLDALAKAGGTPPAWNDLWDAYRNAPAYGLVAWISTLAGDDYQPDAVNLRYIERFGAAYKDLETTRLLRGAG
ncbi:MAG: phosphotransferase [Steroidobacteraceae bacterium]